MKKEYNDILLKNYLQTLTSIRIIDPLYYLKLNVTSDSYLTINKETLYIMTSEKELSYDDEFTYINKFTLNELYLIFSLDDDLIKNRKLFILERV